MAWYDHLSYGDPIVCVDACGGHGIWDPEDTIREGGVYLFERLLIDDDNEVVFILVSPKRSVEARRQWGKDCGYGAFRFRPAQSTDLPVSLLQCLNTPVKKEEREHV